MIRFGWGYCEKNGTTLDTTDNPNCVLQDNVIRNLHTYSK